MKRILNVLALSIVLILLASCDRNSGNPNNPDPDDTTTHVTSSDTITIVYENASARVTNLDTLEGVIVTVTGSDVVVKSTSTKTISYVLSGTSGDGLFKIYSEKAFNLQLKGLNLTNINGPAINNQCQKAAQITLVEGTVNTLTDGVTYDAAPTINGVLEDQGATFFSEGQLIFNGTGTLSITSNGALQHGMNSDDFIHINSGNIIVTSATKDGIHANDGFSMSDGSVTVSSNSDGIDGGLGNMNINGGAITIINDSPNVNGICCDSAFTMKGGSINVTMNGNQSKGIKSTMDLALNGGNVTITAKGGVVKNILGSGFDPSYCVALKSDGNITVDGATVLITHSGEAGKGISTAKDFTLISGNLSIATSGAGALYKNSLGVIDAYSATCISTNGRVDVLGGILSVSSTGMGGKGISADGILTIGSETGNPTVSASTAGASIMSGTTSVTEAKALKSDDNIYLLSGTVLVNTSGAGEGIDTKKSLYMDGGLVVVQGSAVAKTKSIDYATAFNITGGTLMVSGPTRTTIPIPSAATSTQSFLYSTSVATVAGGTLFHIQDALETNLVTYKPTRAAYYFIYSAPNLKANTLYSLYTGGSTTGTETNGFYTDGVYTAGTMKKAFTTSSTSTGTTVTF